MILSCLSLATILQSVTKYSSYLTYGRDIIIQPKKPIQKYRSHLSTGRHHEKSWRLVRIRQHSYGKFYRDNHYLLQAIIVMRSFQRVSTRVMTLIMMPHCERQEDSDSDGNDQSHHTSVLSIIHGIMYAPSDGVKWMPKHIALGSILHQATRSTLLVDLLHKAVHIQLRQANPQGGHLTSARHRL